MNVSLWGQADVVAAAAAAAAATPPTIDLILSLVPQLGVGAVLVWFMLHVMTKLIPSINKENSETIKNIVAEHKAADKEHSDMIRAVVSEHKLVVKDLTDRFDNNLKEERAIRQQELKTLTDAMEKFTEKK